jgi:hypothetical protein
MIWKTFLYVELNIQCEEAIEILRAISDTTTSKSVHIPNGIIPGTYLNSFHIGHTCYCTGKFFSISGTEILVKN